MSHLYRLSKDKLEVIMSILDNQDICKALLYYEDRDFLNKPDVDVSKLLYEQIFPYKKIPNAQEEAKPFITISFGRYKKVESFFKSGLIRIYIIIPRNIKIISTEYGLRHDFIVHKLDEIFNMKNDLGIGRVTFESMDEFDVNLEYIGVEMVYKKYEFN